MGNPVVSLPHFNHKRKCRRSFPLKDAFLAISASSFLIA